MGVNEIKQEIGKNEINARAKTDTLQSLREKIILEIKLYSKENLKKFVEDAVKNNPEHTKELGKETLSEMKKRLLDLLSNSDEVVDKVFSKDSLWIHIGYRILPGGDRYGQRYNNGKTAEENIRLGIKTVLGEAGRILLDYKYVKASGQYERSSEWQVRSNSQIVYGYGLSLEKTLEDLIKQYTINIGELHDYIEKISDLKQRLSKQEAVDLWEEV